METQLENLKCIRDSNNWLVLTVHVPVYIEVNMLKLGVTTYVGLTYISGLVHSPLLLKSRIHRIH
jgi:hypothetical protein